MEKLTLNDMNREQMAKLAKAIYGLPNTGKDNSYSGPNKFTSDK